MQDNSTTTKNLTRAGLSHIADSLPFKAEASFETSFDAAAIHKLYPDLSSFEAYLVKRACDELAECNACKGYPCKRDGYQPVIHSDGRISIMRCKPFEEYLKRASLAKTFKHAKIPPRYEGKTFADYRVDADNKTAVDFAKGLMLEGYSGGYFYGNVGTGKTFLAALIAQEFIKAGKTVLFEKVADLLTEFYAVYRGQGGSEDAILHGLYSVDLLVLDDFGLEKSTQFVGATLSKIIDARYNREGATTIITSNYSLKQIAARLNNPTDMQDGDLCLNGSRIYDRCREICKPILFKGNSRRR